MCPRTQSHIATLPHHCTFTHVRTVGRLILIHDYPATARRSRASTTLIVIPNKHDPELKAPRCPVRLENTARLLDLLDAPIAPKRARLPSVMI